MRYIDWIDGNGTVHEIASMPDAYIKNCIKQIESAIEFYGVKENEGREENLNREYSVLNRKWSKKYANDYLDSFREELEIRDRIKKEDYPILEMQKDCSTCRRNVYGDRTCSQMFHRGECSEWIPPFDTYMQAERYVDREIIRRKGVYIEDVEGVILPFLTTKTQRKERE